MQPGNSRHQTLSAEPLGSCPLRPGEPLCSSARPRLSVKVVCLKFSLCSVFSSVCLVLGFHCSSGCIVFPWVHLPQFIHRVFSFCCFVSSGSSLHNKGEIPPFSVGRELYCPRLHISFGAGTLISVDTGNRTAWAPTPDSELLIESAQGMQLHASPTVPFPAQFSSVVKILNAP